MGLNKEVRDFFTKRIWDVLNAKLKVITKDVDTEKIYNRCFEQFSKTYGEGNLKVEYQKLEQQEKELEIKKSELRTKLSNAVKNATLATGVSVSPGYSLEGWFNSVEEFSKKLYEKDVMEKLYPGISEKINKINKLKMDVQSVVLLATTEPKLVVALDKVLKNYGGEIEGLLELLPKE